MLAKCLFPPTITTIEQLCAALNGPPGEKAQISIISVLEADHEIADVKQDQKSDFNPGLGIMYEPDAY